MVDDIDIKFDRCIRFFLYVLIFWLPYSSAAIEICLGIGLLLWIVKRLYKIGKQYPKAEDKFKCVLEGLSPKKSTLNKPIALFLFFCVLSVLNSSLIEQSWHNFLTKTLEWFIVYFLVIEVFYERKHFHMMFKIWIITTLATAIDSLIQYYITYEDIFVKRNIIPGSRATAGFRTPNSLGAYYIIFFSSMMAYSGLKAKSKRVYLLTQGILVLCLWSLIITFSRAGFFFTILGASFFFVVNKFSMTSKLFKKRYIIIGLVLSILLGGISIIYIRGTESIKLLNPQQESFRFGVWADSINVIKDKPFFGHGINTYMRMFQHYRSRANISDDYNPTYAHNCYLQIAVETGIFGLMGFMYIMVNFVKRGFNINNDSYDKDPQMRLLAFGLFFGICAFLMHSFVDTNFYSLQLSTYLWLMIGLQIAITQMPQAITQPIRNN